MSKWILFLVLALVGISLGQVAKAAAPISHAPSAVAERSKNVETIADADDDQDSDEVDSDGDDSAKVWNASLSSDDVTCKVNEKRCLVSGGCAGCKAHHKCIPKTKRCGPIPQ
jgi:hypothetical protein